MNQQLIAGGHIPMHAEQEMASHCVPKPDPQRVVLPAQDWVKIADAYCGERLAEADGKSPVPVTAVHSSGYLHTIFGVIYGGNSGDYVAQGYRLVPPEMYAGETAEFIDWRDPATFHTRRRGDSTGLLVKVRGHVLVCAKAVHFVRDLPTVKPMSLSEAVEHDEASRSHGWRSSGSFSPEVSWRSLNGHPVVIYQDPMNMRQIAMLFWRSGSQIEEYVLPKQLNISMLTDPVSAAVPQIPSNESPIQMGLF